MPKNAIATGHVDLVLPVEQIAEAITERVRSAGGAVGSVERPISSVTEDGLRSVLAIIQAKTSRDFSAYKPGTLARRLDRRIGMAGLDTPSLENYIDRLNSDTDELNSLIDELLIHVTGFFRDPEVFDHLATNVLPTLIATHPTGQPIRIWVAGCSTGEEVYSLIILLLEALSAAKSPAKLQVFATDIDQKAVSVARNGHYPADIADAISQSRLDRFFTSEDNGYRVTAELRDAIVFSVHDILTDPPFSRIDFVSCRNLLIYLGVDAQEKVLAVFRFALRPGGLLLLGSAESVGGNDDQFSVISKPAHLFKFTGRGKPRSGLPIGDGEALRMPLRPASERAARPPTSLSALCERLVIDAFAPAAALINSRQEVLYTLGPIDRYLRIAPGYPNADLLAMLSDQVRMKVRSALLIFGESRTPARLAGGRLEAAYGGRRFDIDVRALPGDGEELVLISFVEGPDEAISTAPPGAASPDDQSRVNELERELVTARTELSEALRNIERSAEEQKAINEEAMSVNEEYQSTNEELLTSQEELQSLNEELIALNGQLQETLERQRTTSDDLQNVLYSTDAATIFLDTKLDIRFFTPATRSLFSIIASDVGRPLADLRSLAIDGTLSADAARVLETLAPIEREIEVESGLWFLRRILPYRTQTNGVEGVVITFADVTAPRHAADELRAAKALAERANIAKSRFLAAASHDLRQPLQTLSLVHGLLVTKVSGEQGETLMARFDDALNSMSDMLNTLLDINQIEAGTVRVERKAFPLAELLDRLFSELTIQAKAKGLAFRYVPSTLWVDSDPRLLEQMVRNLLMNALKYTRKGAVLLGCRRRGDRLTIEVCDTGIGIPPNELETIFEEYHQVDNVARQHGLGLGLGLSIVQRVGALLRHPVRVRSRLDVGSSFSIDVPVHAKSAEPALVTGPKSLAPRLVRPASILLVEDDPDVSDLLAQSLRLVGYRVLVAANGAAASDLIRIGSVRPELVVTDYNLPNGRTGVEVIFDIRNQIHARIPAIVLTGDISTRALADIADRSCVQLSKPVSLATLLGVIAEHLPPREATQFEDLPSPKLQKSSAGGPPIVFVVDDDDRVRDLIRDVLREAGHRVETYADSETFLANFRAVGQDCLLVDAYLPGMSGLELLRQLNTQGDAPASIMITGGSDVQTAVDAMKAGALDFIEKPIGRDMLLAVVGRALGEAKDTERRTARQHAALEHVAGLTSRQHQIMDLVLAGHPSKNIAADLGISQRTVENHRAAIMKKTGARSLPELARLAVAAAAVPNLPH
ncbi:CheR family methyltransferase [Pleomorphomonas sp. PLEO]|uniref:CheR family methyltransferase n=1 Tax=Pleomorphomonas sp. PLEO TaxID=3239306 RepID=UPI00351E1932